MDGSQTCASTVCPDEPLDILIDHRNISSPADITTQVASIVATANKGSLSVAEAMRQIGMDTMSDYVASTPSKVSRLSAGTSIKSDLDFDLNEIFQQATTPLSSTDQQRQSRSMAPTLLPRMTTSIKPTVPAASSAPSQITICLPDVEAGSIKPERIQEIVQQMISSGKIQLKPDSKVVVNVKSGVLGGVSVAQQLQPVTTPQLPLQASTYQQAPQLVQMHQPKLSTAVQQQVISLPSNSHCQQQVLTLSSPSGPVTAGGLSNQDILRIVSQAGGTQLISTQPQLSQPVTVKLPEMSNLRAGGVANTQLTTATPLQQNTGGSMSASSVNQNTMLILPNQMGQQIKVIAPRSTGLTGTTSTESSGNVILLQMPDNKPVITSQASPGGTRVVSLGSLGGLQTPNKTDHEYSSESPWQQYVKQFNKLGPCPICGDKISGYHYGIFCCESCKGFFKRTVQNGKQYVCHLANNCPSCDVTVMSRKKCPACRFAKCVDKGMRIEAIRLDRTRGGRSMYPGARHFLSRLGGDSGGSGDEFAGEEGECSGMMTSGFPTGQETIIEALGGQYSLKKKQQPTLPKMVADIVLVEQSVANEEDQLEFHETDDENSVYRALLKLSDQRLYRIVRWSRNLPEFSAVDTDDQILLLQNCWADILCLDCCWRSMPTPKEIRLTSHKCINLEAARELGADEVVSSIMQLTQDLVRLKLDQTEYACLKVILLMQPDLKNLKAASRIRLYQEQVSQMLMEYTISTYPLMTNKFGELFLRIPELHRTSTMARDMLVDKDLTPYLCQNSLLMELLRSDCKTGSAVNGQLSGVSHSVLDNPQ